MRQKATKLPWPRDQVTVDNSKNLGLIHRPIWPPKRDQLTVALKQPPGCPKSHWIVPF
jgi:hypothetical protein